MLNSGIVNVSFHFAFVDFVWGIFGFLHDFLCVSLHNMLAILEKSEYENMSLGAGCLSATMPHVPAKLVLKVTK